QTKWAIAVLGARVLWALFDWALDFMARAEHRSAGLGGVDAGRVDRAAAAIVRSRGPWTTRGCDRGRSDGGDVGNGGASAVRERSGARSHVAGSADVAPDRARDRRRCRARSGL